jgi:hypothetical protein
MSITAALSADEQHAAQRRSWVVRELMLQHPEMTRDEAEAIYEDIYNEQKEDSKMITIETNNVAVAITNDDSYVARLNSDRLLRDTVAILEAWQRSAVGSRVTIHGTRFNTGRG